jgi:hypothetical protein
MSLVLKNMPSEAALRHWKDANVLENEDCVENADHLYGFAAECVIKIPKEPVDVRVELWNLGKK